MSMLGAPEAISQAANAPATGSQITPPPSMMVPSVEGLPPVTYGSLPAAMRSNLENTRFGQEVLKQWWNSPLNDALRQQSFTQAVQPTINQLQTALQTPAQTNIFGMAPETLFRMMMLGQAINSAAQMMRRRIGGV